MSTRPVVSGQKALLSADGPQRLQKLLAGAGLGSRRHCEELIVAGRVEVDGRVVSQLGTRADPARQQIRIDGQNLPRPKLVYFVVHKPTGVVSTHRDPAGRPRVIDLVDHPGRLFTVGRLDLSSEGLILVTNDGLLANRLAHPRYGVEKTYHVEVAGLIDRDQLKHLRKGVHLAEGFARVVSAKIKHQYKNSTLLEIVLAEGRNRELRRMLARIGHKVERLKRIALGPLRLGELPAGHVRTLERDELRKLKHLACGRDARARPRGHMLPRKPTRAKGAERTIIGGDSLDAAGASRMPRAAKPRRAERRLSARQRRG